KWKVAFDSAKKRFDEFVKKTRKQYETNALVAKIDSLQTAEVQKALLRTNSTSKEAKELAKKFSKELKIEDKDLRAFLTDEQRAEWKSGENELKAVEARKPKPLPA